MALRSTNLTSSGAALLGIVGTGAMDVYLSGKPMVTFWRTVVQRHTNFAFETLTQSWTSNVAFGASCNCTLNRTADLVHGLYLVVDLPGIRGTSGGLAGDGYPSNGYATNANNVRELDPCADIATDTNATSGNTDGTTGVFKSTHAYSNVLSGYVDVDVDTNITFNPEYPDTTVATGNHELHYAYWVNEIGHALIKRCHFSIGGQRIDFVTGMFMHMWEELSGKPGKRLEEMVGKRYTVTDLIIDSSRDRTLYIPLQFTFTKSPSLALPLVSLQFHGVQFVVEFEQVTNLIRRNLSTTKVVKSSDGTTVLTNNDLTAALDAQYIYLDMQERDQFATGHFTQLTHQVQEFTAQSTQSKIINQLNFNHPVKELIWAVQRQKMVDQNMTFNLSGKNGKDPLATCALKLNNQSRFSREAVYFRTVVPYECHTNIPDSFVYAYSFSLKPEDYTNPSGSLNFSRIDNAVLELDVESDLASNGEQLNVFVYAINWNILKFSSGLGGLLYSS